MKRVLPALVALGLSLTACGGESEAAATPVPEFDEHVATYVGADWPELYKSASKDPVGVLQIKTSLHPDKEGEKLAEPICRAGLEYLIMGEGETPDEAAAIVYGKGGESLTTC